MKIVVLDGKTTNPGDNPWTAIEGLGELTVYDRTSADQLTARAEGAEILVANKTVIDRAVLSQLPNLKFISVLATGYNVIDVAAARERAIPVANVPAYSTRAVSQHVFAMLLSMVHGISEHHRAVGEGKWTACPDFSFQETQLVELAGRTLGIIGFGRIGRRTAQLGIAFGMNVIAHNRSQKNPVDNPAFEFGTFDDVLERSDVVSLHLPAGKRTDGIINAQTIGMMKPGAILINTSRGTLINEAELSDALRAGRIRGACLDVLSSEPPPADNPLLTAPNCLITPHIAWSALEARRRLVETTAENIRCFLAGSPINVVN